MAELVDFRKIDVIEIRKINEIFENLFISLDVRGL